MKSILMLCMGVVAICALVAATMLAPADSEEYAGASEPVYSLSSVVYVCHHPPGQRSKTNKVKKIVIALADFGGNTADYQEEILGHLNNHEGDCYTGDPAVVCQDVVPNVPGGFGATCVAS